MNNNDIKLEIFNKTIFSNEEIISLMINENKKFFNQNLNKIFLYINKSNIENIDISFYDDLVTTKAQQINEFYDIDLINYFYFLNQKGNINNKKINDYLTIHQKEKIFENTFLFLYNNTEDKSIFFNNNYLEGAFLAASFSFLVNQKSINLYYLKQIEQNFFLKLIEFWFDKDLNKENPYKFDLIINTNTKIKIISENLYENANKRQDDIYLSNKHQQKISYKVLHHILEKNNIIYSNKNYEEFMLKSKIMLNKQIKFPELIKFILEALKYKTKNILLYKSNKEKYDLISKNFDTISGIDKKEEYLKLFIKNIFNESDDKILSSIFNSKLFEIIQSSQEFTLHSHIVPYYQKHCLFKQYKNNFNYDDHLLIKSNKKNNRI